MGWEEKQKRCLYLVFMVFIIPYFNSNLKVIKQFEKKSKRIKFNICNFQCGLFSVFLRTITL